MAAEDEMTRDYDEAGVRTEFVGSEAGGKSITLANAKADAARDSIGGLADTARSRAAQKGAAATSSGGADGVRLRQQAAREFGEATARQITEHLAETQRQLQGFGPENQEAFIRQAGDLSARIVAGLPAAQSQLEGVRIQAAGQLQASAQQGDQTIAHLASQLTAGLTSVETSLNAALRSQVRSSKRAVRQAGEHATLSARQRHDDAQAAAVRAINDCFLMLGSRRLRRQFVPALSQQLSGQVGRALAEAASTTTDALGEVAAGFRQVAQGAHTSIQNTSMAGQQSARTHGTSAAASLNAQAAQLAQTMAAAVAAAVGGAKDTAGAAADQLSQTIANIESGYDRALGDLDTNLTGKVAEATAQARKPLDDNFDGRIQEAMDKAARPAELTWYERAGAAVVDFLKEYGPMIAGIVVGLLVTIAVIALIGTGIGALIVAGALAGALSTLASTVLADKIAHRETDWKKLGVDMAKAAVIGGITGALGGGASATIGRAFSGAANTLINRAAMFAATEVVNQIVNVGAAVADNAWHGRPLTDNLGTAIVTGLVMSAAGPAIGRVTERARLGAVESGAAFNVKPGEAAHIRANLEQPMYRLPDIPPVVSKAPVEPVRTEPVRTEPTAAEPAAAKPAAAKPAAAEPARPPAAAAPTEPGRPAAAAAAAEPARPAAAPAEPAPTAAPTNPAPETAHPAPAEPTATPAAARPEETAPAAHPPEVEEEPPTQRLPATEAAAAPAERPSAAERTPLQEQIERAQGRGTEHESAMEQLRSMYEEQQREGATAVDVTSTRLDPQADPRTGAPLLDPTGAPRAWKIKQSFEARRFSIGGGDHLTQITIKARLEPRSGVQPAQIDTVMSNVHSAVDQYYNTGTKRLPNGDQVRVNVEFVTDPAARADLVVDLAPGSGRARQSQWFTGNPPTVQAHELGHQLGLLDEYWSPESLNRQTPTSPGVATDRSLMGNFYTDPHGSIDPGTTVHQRHWDQIGRDIDAARSATGGGATTPAPVASPAPTTPSGTEVRTAAGLDPAPAPTASKGLPESGVHEFEPEPQRSTPEEGGPKWIDEQADRIAAAQDSLRVMERVPGHEEFARTTRRWLEDSVANRDAKRVGAALDVVEDFSRRSPSRGEVPLREVDLTEPAAAAAFEKAMARLNEYEEANPYAKVIEELYKQRERLEMGTSPRETDAQRVARTDRMRGQFMQSCLPDEYFRPGGPPMDPAAASLQISPKGEAIPEAVRLVRSRLEAALNGKTPAQAVANGDAIWLNPATGERLDAPQPGAVLWPAEKGEAWQVDHGVELRHGGNDSVDNYVPAPPGFHSVKTQAMSRFSSEFPPSE